METSWQEWLIGAMAIFGLLHIVYDLAKKEAEKEYWEKKGKP